MGPGGKRGFTIVELLIVIVVIAILAAISIVSYTGIQRRAHISRAMAELTLLAKATELYYADNNEYPPDVDRDIPPPLLFYTGKAGNSWPNAPWPGSVYDYDYFIGSDGKEAVQVSVRFCPLHGDITTCKFPNEPWVVGFDTSSSAYWCIKGKCKAHPSKPDNHPGYCLNCKH